MAWLCAVLMVPLMLFIPALNTKRTRIKRYGGYGWSWKKLLEFMELVLQLFVDGLLLTKVFV